MEVLILRFILVVLLLIPVVSPANERELVVTCREGFACTSMSNKVRKSISSKKGLNTIREKLRFLLLDNSISEMEFAIDENKIEIIFSQRPLIKEVQLTGELGVDEKIVKKTLRLSEGGFYNPVMLGEGVRRLINYYQERGYDKIKVTPNITSTDSGILLNFNINTGKYLLVNDIIVESKSDFIKNLVRSRLIKFKKKPWNRVSIKIELDTLTRELFSKGYFFSSLELLKTKSSDGKKDISVNVNVGLLFNFDFRGNNSLSRIEILNEVKEVLVNNFEDVTPELIKNTIVKIYEKRGVYKTQVKYREADGITKSGDNFRDIFFNIKEGRKIPIQKIEFKGAGGITKEEIEDYYYGKASGLTSRDFLDREWVKKFPSLLKRLYLSKGYLFAEIGDPVITFSPKQDFCNITFHINERQQSFLEEIIFPGMEKKLSDKITSKLINKVGKPLNVVDLEEDIGKALALVRAEGYYFARLRSSDPSKLLLHQNNFNKSKLVVDFDLGKRTKFESVMITGLKVTKQKVVNREVLLSKNDIITPLEIQKIKDRIVALGLFSQVKITPFVTNRDTKEDNYFVNVLIQVNEKDFGSGEVAPGFRTDIGYKVSTKLAYNNLLGLNHSASIKAQTNWRDNLNSLDANRKAEDKNLQEYLIRVNYTWPYAFPSRWDYLHNIEFSTSVSVEQRRLFSFDAEIQKGVLNLSKEFNDKLSASLKYQYEKIRQFDSTITDNDGKFTIGGITSSVNYDLRDSKVNPREGAFFGLSMEFANPIFGSLSQDDLEINFWKIVSRNKFYYPLTRDWTLALSVSTGAQKNLETGVLTNSDGSVVLNENDVPQTKGFIPNIKVFRLDGPDAVRGFATSEINRLSSGSDISEIRIQDRAFFSTIKFEPRYTVNDSVVMGPFFDAGWVYHNNFKPLELRTSAGISLKFVTPVGTLDFDYGFKLKRKRLSSGGKEGFGRFHLSIGFF